MYNLTEYSKNCSKTIGSLWNYYRNELNSGVCGKNNSVNYSTINQRLLIIKRVLQENWKVSVRKKKKLKLLCSFGEH